MKNIIYLLIVLGGLFSVTSSALAQIDNIGVFLDECPSNDPAYLQIIEDFNIRNDGILVDVENILCYEPVSQMDILDYSDELIILQGLKVIYYMDYGRSSHLPWTNETLYDWMKSKVQGINIGSGAYCCTQYEDGLYFTVRAGDDLNRDYDRSWIGIKGNIGLYFHETRHVDGFPHVSCCGISGGCDQAYDEDNLSPYAIQWWLNWAWLSGYINIGFSCLAPFEVSEIANSHLSSCNNIFRGRFCDDQPTELTMPENPGGLCSAVPCECEGNFDGDQDQDGSDAVIFKVDFGRMQYNNPCTENNPCNGDFDCDNDCDGTDASTFKEDFGRQQYNNPCPSCPTDPWCVYP